MNIVTLPFEVVSAHFITHPPAASPIDCKRLPTVGDASLCNVEPILSHI